MLVNKNAIPFYLITGVIVLLSLAVILNLQLLSGEEIESTSNFFSKKETLNLEPSHKTGISLQSNKAQNEDSEIKKRIHLLESSLKDLHSQLASVSIQKTDTQSPEQTNEEATGLAEREREKTQKIVSYLDQQMHREKIDTAWSEDTQTKIHLAFADKGNVHQVECFTSICRISADHDDQDSERAFITKLTSLKPFINTDAFVERKEHEDGSVSTDIFIARSNYRLPDPLVDP
jgi:hypothetical protein